MFFAKRRTPKRNGTSHEKKRTKKPSPTSVASGPPSLEVECIALQPRILFNRKDSTTSSADSRSENVVDGVSDVPLQQQAHQEQQSVHDAHVVHHFPVTSQQGDGDDGDDSLSSTPKKTVGKGSDGTGPRAETPANKVPLSSEWNSPSAATVQEENEQAGVTIISPNTGSSDQQQKQKESAVIVQLENSRCQCTILSQGAQIVSFLVDGVEQLWHSSNEHHHHKNNKYKKTRRTTTKTTGYGAGRGGGIFLAFPQLADAHDEDKMFPHPAPLESKQQEQQHTTAPTDNMPHNGFISDLQWEVTEQSQGSVVLCVRDTEWTRSVWPHAFACRYVIQLQSNASLALSWQVTNTSSSSSSTSAAASVPWSFSGGWTTFPFFDNVALVELVGFKHTTYMDKADHNKLKCQKGPVNVATESMRTGKDVCNNMYAAAGYVDRVYFDTPTEFTFTALTNPRTDLYRIIHSHSFPDTAVFHPWKSNVPSAKNKAARYQMSSTQDHHHHHQHQQHTVCFQSVLSKTNARTLEPGETWHGNLLFVVGGRDTHTTGHRNKKAALVAATTAALTPPKTRKPMTTIIVDTTTTRTTTTKSSVPRPLEEEESSFVLPHEISALDENEDENEDGSVTRLDSKATSSASAVEAATNTITSTAATQESSNDDKTSRNNAESVLTDYGSTSAQSTDSGQGSSPLSSSDQNPDFTPTLHGKQRHQNQNEHTDNCSKNVVPGDHRKPSLRWTRRRHPRTKTSTTQLPPLLAQMDGEDDQEEPELTKTAAAGTLVPAENSAKDTSLFSSPKGGDKFTYHSPNRLFDTALTSSAAISNNTNKNNQQVNEFTAAEEHHDDFDLVWDPSEQEEEFSDSSPCHAAAGHPTTNDNEHERAACDRNGSLWSEEEEEEAAMQSAIIRALSLETFAGSDTTEESEIVFSLSEDDADTEEAQQEQLWDSQKLWGSNVCGKAYHSTRENSSFVGDTKGPAELYFSTTDDSESHYMASWTDDDAQHLLGIATVKNRVSAGDALSEAAVDAATTSHATESPTTGESLWRSHAFTQATTASSIEGKIGLIGQNLPSAGHLIDANASGTSSVPEDVIEEKQTLAYRSEVKSNDNAGHPSMDKTAGTAISRIDEDDVSGLLPDARKSENSRSARNWHAHDDVAEMSRAATASSEGATLHTLKKSGPLQSTLKTASPTVIGAQTNGVPNFCVMTSGDDKTEFVRNPRKNYDSLPAKACEECPRDFTDGALSGQMAAPDREIALVDVDRGERQKDRKSETCELSPKLLEQYRVMELLRELPTNEASRAAGTTDDADRTTTPLHDDTDQLVRAQGDSNNMESVEIVQNKFVQPGLSLLPVEDVANTPVLSKERTRESTRTDDRLRKSAPDEPETASANDEHEANENPSQRESFREPKTTDSLWRPTSKTTIQTIDAATRRARTVEAAPSAGPFLVKDAAAASFKTIGKLEVRRPTPADYNPSNNVTSPKSQGDINSVTVTQNGMACNSEKSDLSSSSARMSRYDNEVGSASQYATTDVAPNAIASNEHATSPDSTTSPDSIAPVVVHSTLSTDASNSSTNRTVGFTGIASSELSPPIHSRYEWESVGHATATTASNVTDSPSRHDSVGQPKVGLSPCSSFEMAKEHGSLTETDDVESSVTNSTGNTNERVNANATTGSGFLHILRESIGQLLLSIKNRGTFNTLPPLFRDLDKEKLAGQALAGFRHRSARIYFLSALGEMKKSSVALSTETVLDSAVFEVLEMLGTAMLSVCMDIREHHAVYALIQLTGGLYTIRQATEDLRRDDDGTAEKSPLVEVIYLTKQIQLHPICSYLGVWDCVRDAHAADREERILRKYPLAHYDHHYDATVTTVNEMKKLGVFQQEDFVARVVRRKGWSAQREKALLLHTSRAF